jgi:ATP-dependent DNA helicase RecQ
MKAVIVAKTRMGGGACVGALTFDGRSLRLIAADRRTNEHFNLDYQVGEVWEIEAHPDPEIIPPHVENVIVAGKRCLGLMTKIETLIERQMPPVCGGPEAIFEGLAQTNKGGALYIAERCGIPSRSTMFWRPDRPLQRVDVLKRIRYRYPTPEGGCTLTFTGFQDPIPEIPAGTLVRVSLAHWWRPEETTGGEYRCYVQLSGWFSNESSPKPCADIPGKAQKETYEVQIPQIGRALRKVFGYPQFRPLQQKIIENVLRKRDSLAVMPTGSGKSLCYQLPATLFPGLTVVVSPLISLMEDQVLELGEWGIPAVYLNSTLSHTEYVGTMARLRSGVVKLLYAAPETLLRPETGVLLESCPVDCLVIDEAHCISEWGHDFRPEYRQFAGLRARLPQAVTLAVTATATHRVRQDIKNSLGITDANEFISSFDRQNLVLSVTDKIDPITQTRVFLDAHQGQAGIIYCATREQVDSLTGQLASLGYPVLPYHAGMDDATRRAHQHRFRYEEGLIMVATIAFGMGINKSNLRFILHYDLPKNIESYYQQIGRAGRDGLPANCLLLYSYADIRTIRYFIDQKAPELRCGSEMRLQALLNFLDARSCRRKPLLAYFGEKYTPDNCGACDNCLAVLPGDLATPEEESRAGKREESVKVVLTAPARLLITCARETGECFGADHLIRVLRGSRAKKVLKFKHDRLSSHGAGRDYSEEQWRQLAGQFIRQGLFERTQPHGSLKVTSAGKAVLQGGEVLGRLPGLRVRTATGKAPEHDAILFEGLRALRARLATERGLPPYIIFHDRSLIEMAAYFPHTPLELGKIYGVGQRKVAEYGPHFLPVIQAYCREHRIRPVPKPSPRTDRSASNSNQPRINYVWGRFQAGESLADIAADLDIRQETILYHLKKAFEAGKPLREDGLKEASQLSLEDEQRVMTAFEELGDAYLKPVFEALDGSVDYDQLNLWRLIFQVRMAKEAAG